MTYVETEYEKWDLFIKIATSVSGIANLRQKKLVKEQRNLNQETSRSTVGYPVVIQL